jgi:hypothetical protein
MTFTVCTCAGCAYTESRFVGNHGFRKYAFGNSCLYGVGGIRFGASVPFRIPDAALITIVSGQRP